MVDSNMNRFFLIASLALCAGISGCMQSAGGLPVKQDRFVKFTSHLGNSFVAPSQWTATDKGDTFSLKSPDGHAVITTTVYTSEGSGSLDEFREMMTTGLLPDGASRWQDSKWTTIKLGDVEAHRRELIAIPDSDTQWRLYVVDGGKYYHAIFLHASKITMALNGEVYETIVMTFEGIRE